jgi:uncharacterized membrane protein YgdD (TMEM256/DUF423 family)
MNRYLQWGSYNMLLAVALGAFGAHGLKDRIDADLLEVYRTGVQYHLVHALGLLLIALAADKIGMTRGIIWSARLLQTGIVLFSGSLYLLAITDTSILGAITPLGGVAFLSGWIVLAVTAKKHGKKP